MPFTACVQPSGGVMVTSVPPRTASSATRRSRGRTPLGIVSVMLAAPAAPLLVATEARCVTVGSIT